MEANLTVTFITEATRLVAGQSLSFGRRADLVIDDNPYLHRVTGRFVFREGLWWLQNHGSRTVLNVNDVSAGTTMPVRPHRQAPLVAHEFTVGFTAGPAHYELECQRTGPNFAADDLLVPSRGTATIDFGVVALSEEQHLLLVHLCEPRLSGSSDTPTNHEIASQLGWSIAKFNRKLDSICSKLSRQGVRGLRGSQGLIASDRRSVLIDHAITVGLVSSDDLGMIPGPH